MLRRLCGKVNCNKSQAASPRRNTPTTPPKRNTPVLNTKIQLVKNYLRNFDPNSIKVTNVKWMLNKPNHRLLTVTMYSKNKNKMGNAAIRISPTNVNFNWGDTLEKYRGKHVGRVLRALLTKAAINVGKYKIITHQGSNMGGRSKMRKNIRTNGSNLATSTWILRKTLGFKPHGNTMSSFSLGNNIRLVNKILNNYKRNSV